MANNVFTRYLPLVLIAILWEVAPRLHIVDPSELPPLSAVSKAWLGLLVDGDLWTNVCLVLHQLVLRPWRRHHRRRHPRRVDGVVSGGR